MDGPLKNGNGFNGQCAIANIQLPIDGARRTETAADGNGRTETK
jgi:hypothetical protein